jgi:hypothetical protein
MRRMRYSGLGGAILATDARFRQSLPRHVHQLRHEDRICILKIGFVRPRAPWFNAAMLLSWKGRGWMVGVSTFGCLLISEYLTGLCHHDSTYYASHGWPKLVAFWASAAISRALVPRTEEVLPGATDISKKKSLLHEQDGLFMIPLKYWPILLIAFGIVFYFFRN